MRERKVRRKGRGLCIVFRCAGCVVTAGDAREWVRQLLRIVRCNLSRISMVQERLQIMLNISVTYLWTSPLFALLVISTPQVLTPHRPRSLFVLAEKQSKGGPTAFAENSLSFISNSLLTHHMCSRVFFLVTRRRSTPLPLADVYFSIGLFAVKCEERKRERN